MSSRYKNLETYKPDDRDNIFIDSERQERSSSRMNNGTYNPHFDVKNEDEEIEHALNAALKYMNKTKKLHHTLLTVAITLVIVSLILFGYHLYGKMDKVNVSDNDDDKENEDDDSNDDNEYDENKSYLKKKKRCVNKKKSYKEPLRTRGFSKRPRKYWYSGGI